MHERYCIENLDCKGVTRSLFEIDKLFASIQRVLVVLVPKPSVIIFLPPLNTPQRYGQNTLYPVNGQGRSICRPRRECALVMLAIRLNKQSYALPSLYMLTHHRIASLVIPEIHSRDGMTPNWEEFTLPVSFLGTFGIVTEMWRETTPSETEVLHKVSTSFNTWTIKILDREYGENNRGHASSYTS